MALVEGETVTLPPGNGRLCRASLTCPSVLSFEREGVHWDVLLSARDERVGSDLGQISLTGGAQS